MLKVAFTHTKLTIFALSTGPLRFRPSFLKASRNSFAMLSNVVHEAYSFLALASILALYRALLYCTRTAHRLGASTV